MTTIRGTRQVATRAAIGVLIALAVVGAGTDDAAAKPKRVKQQNNFVEWCRASGGQPRSVGYQQVSCTMPDGSVIDCNFQTGVCVSQWLVQN